MRYQGYYKNDLRDSIWSFYDSTGKLVNQLKYIKDVEVKK